MRDGLDSTNYVRGEDEYYHFILLAKDEIGHQQIRQLSTRAWKRSWMNGRMRRVPTYYQDLKDIIGTNPGHVIGSTACIGGYLPKLILKDKPQQMMAEWLHEMVDIFGKDDFYLELQPSDNKEQLKVNNYLLKISKGTGIKYIITTFR